jgi:hypothetical protein
MAEAAIYLMFAKCLVENDGLNAETGRVSILAAKQSGDQAGGMKGGCS